MHCIEDKTARERVTCLRVVDDPVGLPNKWHDMVADSFAKISELDALSRATYCQMDNRIASLSSSTFT